jgi:tetratricopeptide (TPR) repeat protein
MSHAPALLVALFVAAPVPPAKKDNGWTGKLVMLRSDDVKAGKPGADGLERGASTLNANMVYKVRVEKDGLLELVGKHGWIAKTDAVPVEDAAAFFALKIKAEKEAKYYGRRALALVNTGRNTSGFTAGGGTRGDTDAALADLAEAVRLDPSAYWWWYQRGMLRLQLSEYDKALEDYDEVVRLQPRWSGGYNGRGMALRAKKEYEKAVEEYTKALEVSPNAVAALSGRGLAWESLKEYDKALADHTKAVELDPTFPSVFNNRGVTLRAKKEYDKAIEDYTKAIELDPMYALAYNNRAAVWLEKKEYQRAVRDSTKAIELDPKFATAFAHRAGALAGLKKYEDAVKSYEAALALSPGERVQRDYALFLASCPDEKYRDGKKALELAKKALEQAGKNPSWGYRSALAAAHAESGDFDLAVAEQKKVLEDKALDKEDREKMEARLELYRAKKPYRDE